MFTINTDEKREEKDTPNSNTQQWLLLILMYIYIFWAFFSMHIYSPSTKLWSLYVFFVIKTN